MNPNYLIGVSRKPASFEGVEIITTGIDYWFAANYNLVKDPNFIPVKKNIADIINKVRKRNTTEKEWHWHHVVETNHLATILFKGVLTDEKFFQMPAVMVHQPEHIYFNSNFRNKEFKELASVTDVDLKISPLNDFKTAEGKDRLKSRIENLRMMYKLAYLRYTTLAQIANNVFNSFSLML